MKSIYVIHENNEIITARNTMDNAIAVAINRIALCGYLCEKFEYSEAVSVIQYRNRDNNKIGVMFIEWTNLKEGV